MKGYIALKVLGYWKWKKQFKDNLLGERVVKVKLHSDWFPSVDREGGKHKLRRVLFKYEYAKYPWFFPSEEREGYQFNTEVAVPIKANTYFEAVEVFNSMLSAVHKYNRRIADMNEHNQLRNEMGIS